MICLFRHAFSSYYSSRRIFGLLPCSGIYCTVESSSSGPKEEESLELRRRGCQRSQVGGCTTQWGYASFFNNNCRILNAIVRLWPLRNTRWVMQRRSRSRGQTRTHSTDTLIGALAARGDVRNLTAVSNNAGSGLHGLGACPVHTLIHLSLNGTVRRKAAPCRTD